MALCSRQLLPWTIPWTNQHFSPFDFFFLWGRVCLSWQREIKHNVQCPRFSGGRKGRVQHNSFATCSLDAHTLWEQDCLQEVSRILKIQSLIIPGSAPSLDRWGKGAGSVGSLQSGSRGLWHAYVGKALLYPPPLTHFGHREELGRRREKAEPHDWAVEQSTVLFLLSVVCELTQKVCYLFKLLSLNLFNARCGLHVAKM